MSNKILLFTFITLIVPLSCCNQQNASSSSLTPDNELQTDPLSAPDIPILLPKEVTNIETASIIKDTFQQFKNDVLSYQGKKAASFMAKPSLEYYDNVIKAAQLSLFDSKRFARYEKRLTPTIRIMVRLLTSRLSNDFIKTATPIQLYETGFTQGWIGYQTLTSGSIDNIMTYTRNGSDYYLADFYSESSLKDNQTVHIGFQFEDGICKIDLIPIFTYIDSRVESSIQNQNINTNLLIEDSVVDSENQLRDDNWPPYVSQTDHFSAHFPKTPTVKISDTEHIHTASHHLYGQFGVTISFNNPDDPTSPLKDKHSRDNHIIQFLAPLGSEKPKCHATDPNDQTKFIQCDFNIPNHNSKGKAIWIFTPRRTYLVFNIANTNQFHEDIANQFIKSFAYDE